MLHGIQSAFVGASPGASHIAALFWWMAIPATLIWLAVVALALYCARQPDTRGARWQRSLIIGGGALFPTAVVTVLLVYGLAMLPPLVARAPANSLHIDVTGEMWWWRVSYRQPSGPVDMANEIRLPLGDPVQLVLRSDNVVHSFWVPAIAGKMDMIPGRTTYLALHPTEAGIFRGACAEYCGTSHAHMGMYVEVMAPDAFARWLDHQASPARAPESDGAVAGQRVFAASGCGACHTVRGTTARGVVGPDLTHVGSRLSIGAGMMPARVDRFHEWVARTEDLKPGVHMPAFGMLPEQELRALAAYLESLE